jgi:hypothetical protein
VARSVESRHFHTMLACVQECVQECAPVRARVRPRTPVRACTGQYAYVCAHACAWCARLRASTCARVCAQFRARVGSHARVRLKLHSSYIGAFGRHMPQIIRIFRLKRTLSDLNDRRDSLCFIEIFRLGSSLSDLIGGTVVDITSILLVYYLYMISILLVS